MIWVGRACLIFAVLYALRFPRRTRAISNRSWFWPTVLVFGCAGFVIGWVTA